MRKLFALMLLLATSVYGQQAISVRDHDNPNRYATVDATGALKTTANFSGEITIGNVAQGAAGASPWLFKLHDGTNPLGTFLNVNSKQTLPVAIVDDTGAQITSFGGGIEFVNGAAIGTGTGKLTHGSVTTNAPSYGTGTVAPFSLDANGSLRVNVTTGAATGVAQGSTTSGQLGALMQGAVTTAAPTYTNGQTSPFSIDPVGGLRVTLQDTSGVAVTTFGIAGTSDFNFKDYGGTPVGATNGVHVQPGTGATWAATKSGTWSGVGVTAGANDLADGASVTFGAKADARNTATDATPITAMQILKQISYSLQNTLAVSGASGLAADDYGTAGTPGAHVLSIQGITSMTPVQVQSNSANLATVAKQPALGTAGTASTDVITIQGIASMTPILTTQSVADAAPGAARTTPPVPVAGEDYGTGCSSGPCIRIPKVSSTGLVSHDLVNWAGAAALAGNGATGTGSPRVTIASDNTVLPAVGAGATGSAVPANAVFVGASNSSGNLTGDIVCDSTAFYDTNTNGRTEMVAISGTKVIYVCGYEIVVGGTATNVSLVKGTGTACVTNEAGLTPAWQFVANGGKVSPYPTHGYLFKTGAGDALCIKTSAGNAVQAQVYYKQQ